MMPRPTCARRCALTPHSRAKRPTAGSSWAVLFRAGQASAAIGEFTRAIELEPDRLSILLRRADASASQGDFTAALEDYATVLQRDPRCAEALAGRSRVRQAQGESELAEADFRAALAIEPSLEVIQPGFIGQPLASPAS